MKNLCISLVAIACLGTAKADITVLFPNEGFDQPAGTNGGWFETGGGVTWSYPTTGGNPGGYGVMTSTGPWGIWVAGNTTPIPIGPMGMVAGETYTFVQDMKLLSGASIGGLKIESWGPKGALGNSGEMRPDSGSDTWQTYTFPYTLAPGTTGIKVVPLWGPNSTVGYDNIGVVVPPLAVVANITSPADNETVSTNFTINATAAVSPGKITRVAFYDGGKFLGEATSYPYSLDVVNASLGQHSLTVEASDDHGNTAPSAAIKITVEALEPPPLTYPTTAAPKPIWPKANVLSLYNSSGTYVDHSPINWYPWGGGGSRGDFTIPKGPVVRSYLAMQYAGVEPNPSYAAANSLNVSAMTTLHVDVWTTADQFGIQLQSVFGIHGNVGASHLMQQASGVIVSNHWVGLDIPLSVFTDLNPQLDLTHIDQLLWLDNFGEGVQNGDFYIDNVFFYNNTPVIQSLAHNGSEFTLKVPSARGMTYYVDATPTLGPVDWQTVQTTPGTGGILTWTVPASGNTQQYFRVRAK